MSGDRTALEQHGVEGEDGNGKEEPLPSCSFASSVKRRKPVTLKIQWSKMWKNTTSGGWGKCYRFRELKTKPKKRKKKKKKKTKRDKKNSGCWAGDSSSLIDSNGWGLDPTLSLSPSPRDHRYLTDYGVKIPPLPKGYDVRDPRWVNGGFSGDGDPPPVKTQEEQNEGIVRELRETQIFHSAPVKFEKGLWARVECFGITIRGTILIKFIDQKYQMEYDNLIKLIRTCVGTQKLNKIDNRIRREDVKLGMVVLAHLEDQVRWIRARIVHFTKEWIAVTGVDEITPNIRLPYEKIAYMHSKLHSCPFQIQECHLMGLSKWQKSNKIRFIWYRLEEIILQKAYEYCEDLTRPCFYSNRKDHDYDENDEPDEDDWIDYFENAFYVTKLKYIGGIPHIRINFPDEVARDVPINDWMRFQLQKFNPFVDLAVTP